MGFLDSIGTVLGGFNDVKQIDTSGFDFREKRRQEQLARQQQQQAWDQANQDYATKAGAEAAVGGLDEGDLAATLPMGLSQAERKARIARMVGQSAQAKSALEDQKTYRDFTKQERAGQQRLDQIGAQGDNAKELAMLRSKLAANQPMSAFQKARLQQLEEFEQGRNSRFQQGQAGMNERFNRGMGRPQRVQTEDENGNAVWSWITPGQEGVPLAPTAIERQVGGMADTVRGNVDEMKALAPDVSSGRVAGNLSKGSQWLLGPHGKEGEFDFDAKAVIDSVYIKSGKQINATEMGILRDMIPDRGKGNLEEQVRLFGDYANKLLQKYGGRKGAAAAGGGGGGQTATFGGIQYRLKPGANPKLKSSWEPIR